MTISPTHGTVVDSVKEFVTAGCGWDCYDANRDRERTPPFATVLLLFERQFGTASIARDGRTYTSVRMNFDLQFVGDTSPNGLDAIEAAETFKAYAENPLRGRGRNRFHYIGLGNVARLDLQWAGKWTQRSIVPLEIGVLRFYTDDILDVARANIQVMHGDSRDDITVTDRF